MGFYEQLADANQTSKARQAWETEEYYNQKNHALQFLRQHPAVKHHALAGQAKEAGLVAPSGAPAAVPLQLAGMLLMLVAALMTLLICLNNRRQILQLFSHLSGCLTMVTQRSTNTSTSTLATAAEVHLHVQQLGCSS
jgi:hypothetical protein